MAIERSNKDLNDQVREPIAEDAPAVVTLDISANNQRKPGPTAADSEADDGLERTEEALREAAEQGRVAKPRSKATEVPVFERGDLPPKV